MSRRDGRSSYLGRDASGSPIGSSTYRSVGAMDEPTIYPVECEYCSERLDNKKHMTLHMRQRHPA